ncbi:MAG: protein kinase [Phycisphaerae bacterium]|jgi:WD40 repeat protein/serine/threonine protein kinase|nr:protein kinase [Phycisphaerae bacterium]
MSSEFSSIDETARRKFEAAWTAGAPEPIEDFLGDRDSPAYLATLEELICIELEFAWRAVGDGSGDKGPLVEEYLQRFSEIDQPDILLRIIEQESAVRHRVGDSPLVAEYRLRFPEIIVTGGELPTIAHRAGSGPARASDDRLSPGDETERYRVEEEFARGGFGEILTVYDKSLHRTVALKQLSSKTTQGREFRRRFLNEARITADLEHPGVVPVYQLHEPEGREPYYTMKLVRGDTLAGAIERFHSAKHSPSDHQVERARLLGAYLTVARTMAFAHSRGVIHRDLKPANIILGQYGETVVLDWGLAKKLGDADDTAGSDQTEESEGITLDVTQAGDVLGTPVYMSPEQASGSTGAMDQRCDVYAMGAILYELLTGSRPYHGSSSKEVIEKVIGADLAAPRSIASAVPKPLEAICLKAMAADPDDRYPSAGQLADDVERYLADQPIDAYSESLGERSARWMRRHRTLGVAGIVGLVVIAGVAITAAFMINKQKTRAVSAESKAVAQEQKTREALGAARRSLCVTRILNAQYEWNAGYLSKADRLLGLCDEDLRQWEWKYLKRLCNSHAMEIRDGDKAIGAAAFSPDGKTIATGRNGGLSLWDAASGKLIRKCDAVEGDVRRVRFSLDGARVFALGTQWISGYDTSSGKNLWKLKEAHGMLFAWAVTPDDKYIMLFNRSQKLITIQADSGEIVHRSAKQGTIISSIAYSPKLKRMALGFNLFGNVRIHQLGSSAEPFEVRSGQRDVYDLAFSDDGALVASAAGNPNSSSGSIKVWDAGSGKLKCESADRMGVVAKVAFSPDGRRIITAGHDRKLTIWAMESGKLIPTRVLRIRGGPVADMSLDNKNNRAVTVGDDGAARVWDLTHDQEHIEYSARYRDMRGAAFGKDSAWFVDATSVARSTRSAEYLGDLIRGGATSASGVAASADGRKFALGASNGKVGVWRTGEFPVRLDLVGHKQRVTALAFSPDSRKLVTGSDAESDIRLWDIEEKKTIRTFDRGKGITRSVSFSPDGKRVLAVCLVRPGEGKPHRYELKDWTLDGRAAAPWGVEGSEIYSFAFSRDGRMLALGDRRNGSVIIRDAADRRKIAEVKGHGSGVSAIAFMPDGRRMVTAGIDRAVKLWDTETWTEVLTLDAGAEMDTLAISSDGNTIVVVDHYAQRARIWNADEPPAARLQWPGRSRGVAGQSPHRIIVPGPNASPGTHSTIPDMENIPPGVRRRSPVQTPDRITVPGNPSSSTQKSPTTRPGDGVFAPGPNSSSDLPPGK